MVNGKNGFWSDDEDGKLEDRLLEIGVERQYRKARQFSYEWDRRSFEENIEQTRKAQEAAEQTDRERRLQAEKRRYFPPASPSHIAQSGATDSRVCGGNNRLSTCSRGPRVSR